MFSVEEGLATAFSRQFAGGARSLFGAWGPMVAGFFIMEGGFVQSKTHRALFLANNRWSGGNVTSLVSVMGFF